jgi:hypothetical protein
LIVYFDLPSICNYSIIVAGGVNGTAMASVEILDEGEEEWRDGPDLPFGIYRFSLINFMSM